MENSRTTRVSQTYLHHSHLHVILPLLVEREVPLPIQIGSPMLWIPSSQLFPLLCFPILYCFPILIINASSSLISWAFSSSLLERIVFIPCLFFFIYLPCLSRLQSDFCPNHSIKFLLSRWPVSHPLSTIFMEGLFCARHWQYSHKQNKIPVLLNFPF